MPTPTEITLETEFEVMDSVDVAPPGAEFEAYVEKGVTQLVLGDQVHPVPFNTQKASLSYVFDELVIFNEVDATPIVLGYIETDKTVDGFEITTSATPDTGNYYVRWKVRIPTTVVDGVVTATASTGAVTEVTAVGQDGLHFTVANHDTAPTIIGSITTGGIPLSKLAEDVLVDDGTLASKAGAETLTNKTIDGNNNTLTNIALGSLAGDGIIAQSLSDPGEDSTLLWNDSTKEFEFISLNNLAMASTAEVKVVTADGETLLYKATADTDTARGAALTAAFTAHGDGDTIQVGMGEFEVEAQLVLAGATVAGQGMGNTVIRLADINGALNSPGTVIAAGGVTGARVTGLTVDCNLHNQSGSNLYDGAVYLGGTECLIDRVHAINWGNTGSGGECFVLSIENDPANGFVAHGNKITNCIVDTPAPVTHSAAGCTAIDIYGQGLSGGGLTTVGNGWQADFEISGNVVHDVTIGSGTGECLMFHAITAGAGDGGRVHHNFVYNLIGSNVDCAAFFIDTWPQYRLAIDNNTFVHVVQGIRNTSSGVTSDWKISGNLIKAERAICLIGGTGYTISDNSFFPNISQNEALYLQNVTNLRAVGNTSDFTTFINSISGNTAITQHANYKSDGTVVGTPTPWTVAEGGTGAASLATMRVALGLSSADDVEFGTVTTDQVIADEVDVATTMVLGDGVGVVCGAGAGVKWGTATSHKQAWWNATPIAQPSSVGETTGFTAGGGTPATDSSTFTGNTGTKAYTVGDIVKHLKAIGLLASS